MRSPLLFALVLLLVGCTPAASPDAGSGPVDAATAEAIYGELVAAGCMAPDDGGPQAVADQLDAGADPWLTCMFAGGSVAACGAPCE